MKAAFCKISLHTFRPSHAQCVELKKNPGTNIVIEQRVGLFMGKMAKRAHLWLFYSFTFAHAHQDTVAHFSQHRHLHRQRSKITPNPPQRTKLSLKTIKKHGTKCMVCKGRRYFRQNLSCTILSSSINKPGACEFRFGYIMSTIAKHITEIAYRRR